MNLKVSLAALTVAAASLAGAAQAATLTVEGYTYTANLPDVFGLQALELSSNGNTDSAASNNLLNQGTSLGGNLVNTSSHTVPGSIGSASGVLAFKFTNDYASGALTAVNLSTNNPLGSFTDLKIAWCADFVAGACVGETSSITQPVGGQSLSTIFANQGDMQFMVATWSSTTGVANDNVDFTVTTTVPLPAGVLLMGTALAGFGVMRRKAKKTA